MNRNMHFYVLGGSGRTGTLLIDEALSRGHTITTLSRNPDKVVSRNGLTKCEGTPYIKEDIESSFTKGGLPSAVLVTLNAATSDNPFAKSDSPPDTLERSNRNTIQVMKAHGVRKIIIMQAHGVGDSFSELNFLMRLVIRRSPMGVQFRDHSNTDKMVRAEAEDGTLQWVMVRPPMLKGETKLSVKEMGNTGKGAGFMPSCSRGSVAQFMVDAAESEKWDGLTPVIMN